MRASWKDFKELTMSVRGAFYPAADEYDSEMETQKEKVEGKVKWSHAFKK